MTTVINNPGGSNDGESASDIWGAVVGILLIVVLAILFFIYGLPAIQNRADNTSNDRDINIDVTLPANSPNNNNNNPAY